MNEFKCFVSNYTDSEAPQRPFGSRDQGPSLHFGFAGSYGYQEDQDSGLKLLGHRYYDPSTGRFLTRDPVKDGRNWYAYAGSDPLGQIDGDGLSVVGDKASKLALGMDGDDEPKDCGKFVRKAFPGRKMPPGSVDTWPTWFKKHSGEWTPVQNGPGTVLQPGDVITIGKGEKGHGHVIIVTRKGPMDASLGDRGPGLDNYPWPNPLKGPIHDIWPKRGGPVTIWRPR